MQKANSGDPLSIHAKDWNRLCDIANAGSFGQRGGNAQKEDSNFVTIKNTLGRDLTRYSAVAIYFPLNEPVATQDYIHEVVNGSLQSCGEVTQSPVIGILPEPIANGRWGKAQIAGVAIARFSGEGRVATGVANNRYGEMSDLGDCLRFSSQGSVRVLQFFTNSGSTANNNFKLRAVLLGGNHPALASVELKWENSNPTVAGNLVWTPQAHDYNGVGAFLDTVNSESRLFLSRPGKYEIIYQWEAKLNSSVTLGSGVPGDTIEWRSDLIDPADAYGGDRRFGYVTQRVWDNGPFAGGEHTIWYENNGAGRADYMVPYVWLVVKRVTGGSVSDVTAFNTLGRVKVIYHGQSNIKTQFLKADADAMWNRGYGAPTI